MSRFLERAFVWVGGAMFVASLAFCAYTYVVTWSTARGRAPGRLSLETGWAAFGFDALLLTVFAMHHSLFARETMKRWLARTLPERLLRSVYIWTASVLLAGACALWQPLGSDVYQAAGAWRLVHGGIQWLGLLLIALSVRSIDPLDLAGIRQRPRVERLQIVGPYRLVRHPLYLGWVLVVFGAAHLTGDRLAFAAITVAYLVVAIPFEERSLIAAFGGAYERYQQHVRWRIVPYVY